MVYLLAQVSIRVFRSAPVFSPLVSLGYGPDNRMAAYQ